ncbi:MAG: GTP pyrophosphokinase family protein, partial [Lachnospiraceae bacterium]|nr:GTP pyrophosphokinase family protein [Lachnospiraceae bacterium]
PSGYRSLHLIVETDVSVDGENRKIRCEIQLRTSAMDSWASLEHNMRYKSDLPENEQINESLKSCAEALHNTDLEMQSIAQQLGIIS